MATMDVAIGTAFLLQTVVGIVGNISLLYYYLFFYFTKCGFKSRDLIIIHLNIANTLVILSKGVSDTMAALGLNNFPSDFGCKLIFYLHKLGRDMSFGSTCLLSVFQAIIIIPRDSRWAKLKVKSLKYMSSSSIFIWVLNMALNITVPMRMTSKWSNKNDTNKIDFGYCSGVLHDKFTHSFFIPLVLVRDVLCLGLMLSASSSIVFVLYRHKQQMQHIHRSNTYPRSSPESRATRSILILVSTFLSLCALSSLFLVHLAILKKYTLRLLQTSRLIAGCFPTVSPYILMSHDPRLSRLHFHWIKNTKFPSLVRDM